MGSNLNFKNFGNEPQLDGSGSGRPPGNFPLVRQSSIYSLTFDEFQSTLGGVGKDFGSMNMDELLKNIWSAEETQNMAAAAAAVAASGGGGGLDGVNNQGGFLQRQGSLTLPRTLSQKTVDEVWKDISREYVIGKDGGAGSNMPQRQQTLGEMTLEEFLARAGVVREDTQLAGKPTATGFFGDITQTNNNTNTGFGINFQQPGRGGIGLMGNHISDGNNQISMQSPNLPLNVNGVRTSQQQPTPPRLPQQRIFPKQAAVSYTPAMAIPNGAQLSSPGVRGGIVGLADPAINNNLAQGAALQGGGMAMAGLGAAAIGVATGSPTTLSSNGLAKSNGDTSSVSPVPYVFNGGLRGRKYNNAVEKVIERRQRRMIKNRESAARSRARKQAYTMELEQEVTKLKEENQDLRKKHGEIMEMQKNQALEMMNAQYGTKRRCLRRTQTGPCVVVSLPSNLSSLMCYDEERIDLYLGW
ncbi:ARM REPEAT PROTEIN INTERACTING WITH abf2 [Ancistrocladus abbreviatus]